MRDVDLFEQIFTVSELNALVKQSLEGFFRSVKIEGEISGLKLSGGHYYFTLKDERAAIAAVMFRGNAYSLKFAPKDGDKVVAEGRISIYEPRGTYQIILQKMEKAGEGDILAELERRKKLFAPYFKGPEKQRKMPTDVKTVCVVTSPTGAVIHDIINVRNKLNPAVNILLIPAVVQGEGAAESVASGILTANRLKLGEVLIVGRGGGSVEDLLPFSEECVVKAVSESEIPVISAVGHDTDWALCDYAADARAATPTQAAEFAFPDRTAALRNARALSSSMAAAMRSLISTAIQKNSHMSESLRNLLSSRIKLERRTFDGLKKELFALSPTDVLKRGYAVVEVNGKAIKNPASAPEGAELEILLADGKIAATSKGEIK